jgi:hypothetical protein
MDKRGEHQGTVIAQSTIRRVTLRHAKEIPKRSPGLPHGLPKKVAPGQTFITGIDITMVPTVSSGLGQRDPRKGQERAMAALSWARLPSYRGMWTTLATNYALVPREQDLAKAPRPVILPINKSL